MLKPYASVKTGVLVFRRPLNNGKKRKKTNKVWFYEVRNDGYDPDKIVGGGRPETPDENDIRNMLSQWRTYKDFGFKKPPGVEARTLLPPGSEEPGCWWATMETIAQNDYNLAAGRYKPQVAEEAPQEDPEDLVPETLRIEQDIAAGLEKLLGELGAKE